MHQTVNKPEIAISNAGLNAAVSLIGKDGGIKERASSLDLYDLFGAVDAMPMRQYEMDNR